MVNVWYPVLLAISRLRAPAYWRMSNGAAFWWTPVESEILPDGFATQPFNYCEVQSVTVYQETREGGETLVCNLAALREELAGFRGVRAVSLAGVRPWPSSPLTEALELSADA